MEQLIQFALLLISIFGGAKVIEKTLENFVMNQSWMPQGLKKWVVPVGSLLTGLITSVAKGVPLEQAMLAATVGAGLVDFMHDHPSLTAADWPMPPAPDDALLGGK